MNRSRMALMVAMVMAAGMIPLASQHPSDDRVELSAIVTDSQGIAVTDLHQSDFSVREDGRPVSLTTFDVVGASRSATHGRSVALLLGSAGLDPSLTPYVQKIANGFLDQAGTSDQVSVVRFARSNEELAGSRAEMQMRIAEYRASYGAPLNPKSWQDALESIERIARQLGPSGTDRRAIVCIGPSTVFDVIEPPQREYELLWPYWVRALTETARANASIYVIDPKGLTGRIRLNPDGLVVKTGGIVFDNTNDFMDAVHRVWQETSSYYALGYTAMSDKRELHDIEVKISRPGLQVRARRAR